MRIRPYQKLIAWQEAHKLCVWVHEITKQFPQEEKFRLTNQMCRSAQSVPMNIAEGNTRRTRRDQMRFLTIGLASLEELHYQFILARDLHYISHAEHEAADDKIQRTGYLTGKLRASLYVPEARKTLKV